MATTILQSFRELRTRLEITGLQGSTVSTRQQNVRDVLEKGIDLVEPRSFLAGSYQRNTMIAPLTEADIDIFFVLDPKYFQQAGQAALLDKVKGVLRKTYTQTPEISRNGQAVTITFTDFKVDVVPGFNRNGGGFLIPNAPLGKWLPTDPRKHIEIWAAANKAHQGDLVPLLKMLKAWNKMNGQLLTSFHLEALALQVLNNVTISDFPSGTRFFFEKARSAVRLPVSDPSGYDWNIGSYLDSQAKMDAAASHLETGYQRASAAEALEKNAKTKDAVEKWRLVFGDYFPAYG